MFIIIGKSVHVEEFSLIANLKRSNISDDLLFNAFMKNNNGVKEKLRLHVDKSTKLVEEKMVERESRRLSSCQQRLGLFLLAAIVKEGRSKKGQMCGDSNKTENASY